MRLGRIYTLFCKSTYIPFLSRHLVGPLVSDG